ncbi:jg19044 [Pararge aegeria aegeria]|uniref:Jg19044 protein n=1 Tax=Pararge aegeria aegeria TaxID=348720 RepID=A0A8S4R3Q9_9NEOP|nr:jg19044 [Pararge aegeria aegeria]
MGTVTIYCPIEVAKVLSEAGRLFVGWSAAEVQVLEQSPLRCFRCLGIRHTWPVCPSSADRGNLCYRCGVDGHRTMECTGEIRCAICADGGLQLILWVERAAIPPSRRAEQLHGFKQPLTL